MCQGTYLMDEEEIINKLSRTLPRLRDEPQAYVKALLRMGYEAGKKHVNQPLNQIHHSS